jgi:hypothetical protein
VNASLRPAYSRARDNHATVAPLRRVFGDSIRARRGVLCAAAAKSLSAHLARKGTLTDERHDIVASPPTSNRAGVLASTVPASRRRARHHPFRSRRPKRSDRVRLTASFHAFICFSPAPKARRSSRPPASTSRAVPPTAMTTPRLTVDSKSAALPVIASGRGAPMVRLDLLANSPFWSPRSALRPFAGFQWDRRSRGILNSREKIPYRVAPRR